MHFQKYVLFVFDSSAAVDDDVDGCDVVAVGVATTSDSVGDFMTELSASVSSSISAWTFENTPSRAKLSKNSVPVFNMISSSIFNTTKCPSSSSCFQKKGPNGKMKSIELCDFLLGLAHITNNVCAYYIGFGMHQLHSVNY